MALYLVWANFDQTCLFIVITEKPTANHVPTTNFSTINLESAFDELSDQNVTDTDASHTHTNHTHTKNVSSNTYLFQKIFLKFLKLIDTLKNFQCLFKNNNFLSSISGPKSLCKDYKGSEFIVFPYPHKPTYYVQCLPNGTPVCRRCPEGLIFNNKIKVCDFPAKKH